MKDEILIQGLKENNKIIFNNVFSYYYSALCSFAVKYIKNKSVAEDIVQDFFVKLWVDADKINISTSIRAYLYTAVKNKCLDYLRHQSIKEKYISSSLRDLQDNLPTTDIWMAEIELEEVINEALKAMPPRCRYIFELSRFQCKKNLEIAAMLNISKRTVEIQVSNALKILRLKIDKFFDD